MYEDLVKSLKICGTPALINEKCIAFHDGCCEAEPVCMYELMRKAADAIEELSRDLDSMNDANVALYGALPKWIPVTERLPEEWGDYLCWHEYYHFSRDEILPEYGLGVWNNDDKCWCGEVRNGRCAKVLYWMPLPEPPKEGE